MGYNHLNGHFLLQFDQISSQKEDKISLILQSITSLDPLISIKFSNFGPPSKPSVNSPIAAFISSSLASNSYQLLFWLVSASKNLPATYWKDQNGREAILLADTGVTLSEGFMRELVICMKHLKQSIHEGSLDLPQMLQNVWALQLVIKFIRFVGWLQAQLSDVTGDSQLVEEFKRVIESYFEVFGETGHKNFKVKDNGQR
jgi:hypothetical protein